PAGGNVLCYLALARCLGPGQPFYGLQTPGLYGERPLYNRIEDLAAHYIEALRGLQPEGPYFLGGWSLGGPVAYELAQQLLAAGQSVGQLLLLDCSGWAAATEQSGEDQVGIEEDQAQSAEGEAALLKELLAEDLPISWEELEPYEGDERIDYILKR